VSVLEVDEPMIFFFLTKENKPKAILNELAIQKKKKLKTTAQ